jgi:acyl-CoA hydrolase
VDPKTPTVTRGTTLQFTGTVEATGGLPTTVTWRVVEEDIKKGTTISATGGLLTVDKDETAGRSLTVKATSTKDTTKFDTATVTVSAGPEYVVTISLDFAGNIILSGGDETNTISKDGNDDHPTSLTLSAEGYDSPAWYVDGVAKGSAGSITINAEDYDVRRHSVSFTGSRDGVLYAKEISFTVVD